MSYYRSHRDDPPSRSRSLSKRDYNSSRYSENRRDFPSRERRRRLDDSTRQSDILEKEKQNLRRHSSTISYQDPSGDRPLPPARSQTQDLRHIQTPSATEAITLSPQETPSLSRPLVNPSLTAAPPMAKRPAEMEPVLDPRKRVALSGKNGPRKAPTESPTIPPAPLPESKSSRQSSAEITRGRSGPSQATSREDKVMALRNLLIHFAEQTAATMLMGRKADELEAAASKAALANEKNHKIHEAYRALIEQGEEQRMDTQRKASSAKQKYEASISPRDKLADKVANEMISLIEEPIEISKRITSLEERWERRQLEQPAQHISLDAFTSLENAVKDMMKENKELKIQLSLKSTHSDMIASQLAMQESIKVIEKKLELSTAGSQSTEMVSHSEVQTLLSTTTERINFLFSQLEKVDKARLSDFQDVASDIQKNHVEFTEWKRGFETSTDDRDEEVIRLSDQVTSILAELKDISAEAEKPDANPETKGVKANGLVEAQSRLDGELGRSPNSHMVGTSENFKQSSSAISSLDLRLHDIEEELATWKTSTLATAQASNSNIFSLNTRLDEIGNEVQQLLAGPSELSKLNISQMKSRLKAVETGWTQLRSVVSISDASLTDKETRLNAVETGLTQLCSDASKTHAGLVSEMQRLDAIESGLQQHRSDASAQTNSSILELKKDVNATVVDLRMSQAATSEQANTITQLKTRLDGMEAELRQNQDLGLASEHSIKVLSNRFNNLTTETLTRAMLQQISVMYPYMATVQEEFTQARTDREKLRLLGEMVEALRSANTMNTATLHTIFNKRSESDMKLADVTRQVREAKEEFEKRLEFHENRVTGIEAIDTEFRETAMKFEQRSETFQTTLDDLQSRQDANDEEFLKYRAAETELRTKLAGRVDVVEANTENVKNSTEKLAGRMDKVAENLAAKAQADAAKKPASVPIDDETIAVMSSSRPTETPKSSDEYLKEWNATKGPPERSGNDTGHSIPRGPRNSTSSSSQPLRLGNHETTLPPGMENRKRRHWDPEYDPSDDDDYHPGYKSSKAKSGRPKKRQQS